MQLRQARLRRGMTLAELRRQAGIGCSAISLGRKLSGKQILTTDEAQELARVLQVKLVWASERSPRRGAA
jgi:transcriptional regulator with XRE-family HTH domain